MKNITVAIDDETYRKACVAAAHRDSSVSALVKTFLVALTAEPPAPRDLKLEQEAFLHDIASRHPGFSCRDNLSRDALYDRH